MNNFITRNLKGDKGVWMVLLLLCVVSVAEMFSSSTYLVSRTGSISAPILRHVTFIIAGCIAMFITMLVPFKLIRMLGYLGLGASWLLLVYTLFFGVEAAGAARFLNVGGFQFQPSELAKLSLLIVVADFTDRCQNETFQQKAFPIYAGIVTVTCGLIFTENLSTAAILFMVSAIMMFIGAVKFRRIAVWASAILLFVGLIIGIAAVIPEEQYRESDNRVVKMFGRAYTWVARIENFFVEDTDPEAKYIITDENRQVVHAQIAVASGGLFGVGPGNSVQRNFLPEAFSDFIYAIIVEELGLVFGGILVIFLYMWLLFRAGKVARMSNSMFRAILVIGVTLMIVIQAFIHMGVAVHLGPVTGQPLPLISRGGTSILVNCVYFGIILSATRQIALETQNVRREEDGGEQMRSEEMTTEDVVVAEEAAAEETKGAEEIVFEEERS